MDWSSLYSQANQPTMDNIGSYIDSVLWNELNEAIRDTYHIEPSVEYSRCSMQAGWNVKYKKSGRALCTLYPMEGYFIAMIVVGSKEMPEAELLLPLWSDYVRMVFERTKTERGMKWLMLDVRNEETVKDILDLIQLRMKSKAAGKK